MLSASPALFSGANQYANYVFATVNSFVKIDATTPQTITGVYTHSIKTCLGIIIFNPQTKAIVLMHIPGSESETLVKQIVDEFHRCGKGSELTLVYNPNSAQHLKLMKMEYSAEEANFILNYYKKKLMRVCASVKVIPAPFGTVAIDRSGTITTAERIIRGLESPDSIILNAIQSLNLILNENDYQAVLSYEKNKFSIVPMPSSALLRIMSEVKKRLKPQYNAEDVVIAFTQCWKYFPPMSALGKVLFLRSDTASSVLLSYANELVDYLKNEARLFYLHIISNSATAEELRPFIDDIMKKALIEMLEKDKLCGKEAFQKGEHATALTAFSNSLQLQLFLFDAAHPQTPALYYDAGSAALKMGDFSQARNYFERTLDLINRSAKPDVAFKEKTTAMLDQCKASMNYMP